MSPYSGPRGFFFEIFLREKESEPRSGYNKSLRGGEGEHNDYGLHNNWGLHNDKSKQHSKQAIWLGKLRKMFS